MQFLHRGAAGSQDFGMAGLCTRRTLNLYDGTQFTRKLADPVSELGFTARKCERRSQHLSTRWLAGLAAASLQAVPREAVVQATDAMRVADLGLARRR